MRYSPLVTKSDGTTCTPGSILREDTEYQSGEANYHNTGFVHTSGCEICLDPDESFDLSLDYFFWSNPYNTQNVFQRLIYNGR